MLNRAQLQPQTKKKKKKTQVFWLQFVYVLNEK